MYTVKECYLSDHSKTLYKNVIHVMCHAMDDDDAFFVVQQKFLHLAS